MTRTNAVGKKASTEFSKTEEYKEFNNLDAGLRKFRKQLAEQMGVKENQIRFDNATELSYQLAAMRYKQKFDEIMDKYKDEMVEATLRDLDYDVTDRAKEYVKKILS